MEALIDLAGYQVEQDSFSGPMDLLLHLIKKDEVDIFEIDISRLTDQFLEFMKVIDLDNIENAGDFIIMAATLLEIKSKALLPKEELSEEESTEEELRANLIRQLLEYKKFKGLSKALQFTQDQFLCSYPNQGSYVPDKDVEGQEIELRVSLTSLMLSIAKVVRDTSMELVSKLRSKIVPLTSYLNVIKDRIVAGSLSFFQLKRENPDPMDQVSNFMSILELSKQKVVRTSQAQFFGDILIESAPAEDAAEPSSALAGSN